MPGLSSQKDTILDTQNSPSPKAAIKPSANLDKLINKILTSHGHDPIYDDEDMMHEQVASQLYR
jgi:hypothetical protein